MLVDDVVGTCSLVEPACSAYSRLTLLRTLTRMSREGQQLKVVQVILLFLSTFLWMTTAVLVGTPGTTSNVTSSSSSCSGYATCGQCIAASCHWCQLDNFTAVDNSSLSRCQSDVSVLLAAGCTQESIHSPNWTLTLHNDTPPRDAPDDTAEAIQLAPQNITVRVAPNRPFTFPVTFRLAANFPVDLYFLMDASKTMEGFKKALANVTETLVTALGNITRNYRLGMGAYVDKVTAPFCSSVVYEGYDAPYSYRHLVTLTRNVTTFRDRVNATGFAGNLDTAEGVFDALVQVAMCSREIGWRDQSRKMIVVSTDADFHVAGDGRLAGIMEPNDGRCHLDSSGEYTEAVRTDYPSISQLANIISAKKMNLIFAIAESKVNVNRIYELLTAHIEGSNVGRMTSDCANIVDIIRDNYDKISGTVQLKAVTDEPDVVSVSFRSKCLNSAEQATSTCEKVPIGKTVTFNVTVHVRGPDACPADRTQWSKKLVIHAVGLTEKLHVNIELDCECPCESPAASVPRSPVCNSVGTHQCGVCACAAGYQGDRCECSDDTDPCRPHGNATVTSAEVCSGRGRCQCGRCVCESATDGVDVSVGGSEPSKRRYSGEFCECDNYACEYFNGQLCGGPARGVCSCGQCQCSAGWKGARCDCTTAVDQCLASNGKICNGVGRCVCNECECDDEKDGLEGVRRRGDGDGALSMFRSRTCEICPTCTEDERCQLYTDCIRCAVDSDRASPSTCRPLTSCSGAVRLVDEAYLDAGVVVDWPQNLTVGCQARLDDFCTVRFVYHRETGWLRASRRTVCRQQPINYILIIVGVVASILAIGIALLLAWKIYVTMHDRREYASFEQEYKKARSKSIDNPLYRNVVTKYQNPTFMAASD